MNKIFLIVFLVLDIYASSVKISVIQPQVGNSTVSIEANGIVIPKNKRVLTAQTTGVLQLFIHNNISVKKGEKIAYIKNKRREKNLKFLKRKLSLEQKGLQLQQHKLEIAKRMFTMGVGSKNFYLNQKLALE